MAARKTKAQKAATATVERLYQANCGFVPIGIFDIKKVLELGEESVLAGDTEEVTTKKLVAFVELIRKDR